MIPHSSPTVNDAMIRAVVKSLRSKRLSMGPEVAAFEEAFAVKFGLPSAAVASGTAALHLALASLGVGEGDEVVLPAYVCTALLNAVNYTGATAVLADVDLSSGNITAAEIRKKLTRRSKAVVVAHMFGAPAEMKPILALGVPVIEDCAQATGACYAGKPVGTMGRIGIFSFYATKMMTTGEGGMVASADKALMLRVRDLLGYDHKDDYRVRFNYKMTDMQAALGVVQLSCLDKFISRRRRIAALYDKRLGPESRVLPDCAGGNPVHYRYVVRVRGHAEGVVAAMARQGIACALPLFRPLHRYLNIQGFPAAEQLMQECVSLPIYPGLSDAAVRRVADAFKAVAGELP